MRWRWDQGRLDYYNYQNINLIAKVLVDNELIELNQRGSDPLRFSLEQRTNLPFSPKNYKVWRNYGRVFVSTLLATNIDGRLGVSDLCRELANGGSISEDPDDYFLHLFRNTSYPHPAFQGYNPTNRMAFPFSAIIKLLLARHRDTGNNYIELSDVFKYLLANEMDGTESIDDYCALRSKDYKVARDEDRQVREMLIFASQVSFLKWFNHKLILDLSSIDSNTFNFILKSCAPNRRDKKKTPTEEFFEMSKLGTSLPLERKTLSRVREEDLVFTEGKRRRTNHVKIERSPALRRAFFSRLNKPFVCDLCRCEPDKIYPWTDNILEVHHLLPLSSTLNVRSKGTSLDDVVPLCPNCHKGTHHYYSSWLKTNGVPDFPSKEIALNVYADIRTKISA